MHTSLEEGDSRLIVMMICHYDETNSSGGLDKQARLLSHELRSRGEQVVVLASTRKLSNARWSMDNGVPVRLFWTYASPQVSGRYLPAALIWAFQLFGWIAVNRSRIALLHCHQLRMHSFVGALARKLFRIPVIHKMASGGPGSDIKVIGTRKYFGSRGRSFVIFNSDRFVALTESMRRDFLSFGVPGQRIAVIPNGLKLSQSGLAGPISAHRSRRCLFLARLAPDKNVPELARAALQVAKECDLTVHFYGKGRELTRLEAVLAEGGDPRVSYKGWVSDPAVLLTQYGYLLLASDVEGLSNSMIESMAQGVVPVVTRVSGAVDHIVHGYNGFFFEGTDERSLVAGLRLVGETSQDQWIRMSVAARDQARSTFDMDNVALAYQQLYADLTGRADAQKRQ